MPLSYNIKIDGLAVGDGQFVTDTLTIAAGDTHLHSTANLFVSGDATKSIVIDTISLKSKIDTYVGPTHVILHDPAPAPGLSAASTRLAWGTNDSPAFVAFNTAAKAATGLVTLTIPSGIYLEGSTVSNELRWQRFVPQLKIVGIGSPMLTGNTFYGTLTTTGSIDGSARVASVNPGSTTLQLLNISDASRFQPGRTKSYSDGTVYTAGTFANLTGLDTQGFGDPNHQHREYVNITNVNVTTGLITLSATTKNQYLSTWPLYNQGDAFHPDCGGPATLYMFDASWDASIEFVGIQFWGPLGAINCQARFVKFTSCTWIPDNSFNLGGHGFFPAACESWTLDGTTFGSSLSGIIVEVDKNIAQANIINGSSGHVWWTQSASAENLLVDSSTIDQLKGTFRNTVINNSAITALDLGPTAYGRADKITATNSSFGSINYLFAAGILPNPNASCVGGRISVATGSPLSWAMPGTRILVGGAQEASSAFSVLALTGDGDPNTPASNTFVDCLGLNGFPNIPLSGGTGMVLTAQPAPIATFIGCTGCDDARDLSNLKAQGRPAFSYSNRTYAGVASGAVIALVNPTYISTEGPRLWGKIVSVTVTVGVAFTTAGTLSLNLFGRFVTNACDPLTGALTTWVPQVDLKTPGTRTITATAFNNIALSADNLGPAPGSIFFNGRQQPWLNGTVAGGDPGIVTIEVQTDQGLLTMSRNMKGDF